MKFVSLQKELNTLTVKIVNIIIIINMFKMAISMLFQGAYEDTDYIWLGASDVSNKDKSCTQLWLGMGELIAKDCSLPESDTIYVCERDVPEPGIFAIFSPNSYTEL